jgi:uncharacterized protein
VSDTDAPYLGVGIGLRPTHYPDILGRLRGRTSGSSDPALEPGDVATALGIDWLEVLSENYMIPGGRPRRILRDLVPHVPLVLHGVSLNIGSTDPLSDAYLDQLADLAELTGARWISDHLCWTGVGGHNLHDLVPLPYTEAALRHVSDRVRQVQDRLGRRIALENVSSYMSYRADAMSEWEFLARVAERADCGILLDVNNVFVSAHNHGFDAHAYLDAIPCDRVFQIHLAGHSEEPPLLIDTHDHPVRSEVWELYAYTIDRVGPISTLIEWDDHIPEYAVLVAEADRARAILESRDSRLPARADAMVAPGASHVR